MLVVAGDWNSRPGPVDMATRYILGKFALGPRCGSGDRLVNIASTNQRPQRYLVTWFANDERTRNLIDHMLVRPRWDSSVNDYQAYNGSDNGSNRQ